MASIPEPALTFTTARERPTLTVPEAAVLLGVSKDSAYRAVHAGQIPTLRIGRRILVCTPKLLALLGGSLTEDAQ